MNSAAELKNIVSERWKHMSVLIGHENKNILALPVHNRRKLHPHESREDEIFVSSNVHVFSVIC